MAVDFVVRTVDRATAAIAKISQRIQGLFAPLQRLRGAFRRLADSSGIDRIAGGFGRVRDSLGQVGGAAKQVFGSIAQYAGAAALSLGLFVNAQVEAADSLGIAANRVGFSVTAYDQYRYAAEAAGIAQEQFTSGLDTLNKSLGEARVGKGKLESFLKDVSPSLLKAFKASKTTEEGFGIAVGALEKIQDPAKRAALSLKFFGNADFTQLIGQLDGARKAIAKADGSTELFVKRGQELDGAMDELKRTIGLASRDVATQLFPAFKDLAEMLGGFLSRNREQIKAWAKTAGENLIKFAKALPGYLEKISAKFERMTEKLRPLAELVGGFGNLLGIVAGLIVTGPLLAALASLTSSFISLGIAIGATPVGWFLAAVALLAGAAFLIYKNWGPLTKFFTELWDGVKGAFQGWLDFFVGIFTLDIERAIGGIKKQFESLITLAEKLWALQPSNIGRAVGGAIVQEFSGDPPRRPTIGADAARPMLSRAQPAQSLVQTNNAKVQIDLTGVPRGAKVSMPASNKAEVQMNVGYLPELGW